MVCMVVTFGAIQNSSSPISISHMYAGVDPMQEILSQCLLEWDGTFVPTREDNKVYQSAGFGALYAIE